MKKTFLIILFVFAGNCYGQSLFNADTVLFVDEHFDISAPLDTNITEVALVKNSSHVTRCIFIDSNKNVYWHENPFDSFKREELNRDLSVDFNNISYAHIHSYPLFKTVKNNNKIYYQVTDRSLPVILQASLLPNDTVNVFELPVLNTIPSKDYIEDTSIVQVVSSKEYLIYYKDTILNINNLQIPCYVFKGNGDWYGDGFYGGEIMREIYIEKISLLPILTHDRYYNYKWGYDNQNKFFMTKTLNFINIIIPCLPGLEFHIRESPDVIFLRHDKMLTK